MQQTESSRPCTTAPTTVDLGIRQALSLADHKSLGAQPGRWQALEALGNGHANAQAADPARHSLLIKFYWRSAPFQVPFRSLSGPFSSP